MLFRHVISVAPACPVCVQKSFSSISSYGEVFKSPPSQKRNHQSFINNGSEYVERALELLSDHLNPGDSVLEIGTRNTDSLITLRGMVKRAGVVHGIALSELEVWHCKSGIVAWEGLLGCVIVRDEP